jgi:septum site-determining protein MinD
LLKLLVGERLGDEGDLALGRVVLAQTVDIAENSRRFIICGFSVICHAAHIHGSDALLKGEHGAVVRVCPGEVLSALDVLDAVYDIGDVVAGRISLNDAVTPDPRTPNIHFIAAPYDSGNKICKNAFCETIKNYAQTGIYDFIFIDTLGGIGEPLEFAASVADTAYIIVNPTVASIRAAERTGIFLSSKGVSRERLIVNKFSGRSVKKAKEEVISFIDETAIKLIGVVPYDTEILRAGNAGKLVDEILSNNISYAFENIAYRTLGQARPLFCNIKKLKKLR